MAEVIKKYKKKKIVWFPAILIVLLSGIIFTNSVFSQEELKMNIVFDEDEWDPTEGEFSEDWVTNKDEISFDIDLTGHVEGEESLEEEPFNVNVDYVSGGSGPDEVSLKANIDSNNEGIFTVTADLNDSGYEQLQDGEFHIYVEIREDNGWGIPVSNNPIEFLIERDITSPELIIEGVENGDTYEERNLPTAEIRVNDDESEVIIEVKKNNEATEIEWEEDDLTFTHQFTDDGRYDITATAVDPAGNEVRETVYFYVHIEDPELVVRNAADGEVVGNDRFFSGETTLEFNVFNSAEILNINAWYIKDNGYSRNYLNFDWDDIEGSASETFREDGKYDLTIRVRDQHSWSSRTHELQYSFEIDSEVPVVSVKEEGKREVIDNITQSKKVIVEIQDDNFDQDNPSNIQVFKDGNDDEVAIEFSEWQLEEKRSNRYEYTYEFTEDGAYRVLVHATDLAGNITSTEVQFTIDSSGPEIVTSGIDKEYYNQEDSDPIDTHFLIADEHGLVNEKTSIEINGESMELEYDDDGMTAEYSHVFDEENTYRIVVSAEDVIGNKAYVEKVFTIDRTLPEVTFYDEDNVLEPDGDYFSSNDSLKVEVEDVNFDVEETVVTVNGKRKAMSEADWEKAGNGIYSTTLDVTANDTYNIAVTAVDRAGNEQEEQAVSFTVDNEKPNVMLYEKDGEKLIPLDENISSSKTVVIEVTDANFSIEFSEVKVNGDGVADSVEDWTEEEGVYTTEVEFDEDGEFHISVLAIDKANNVAEEQTAEFIIDQTKPRITFFEQHDDLRVELEENISSDSKNVIIKIDDANYDEKYSSIEVKDLYSGEELDIEWEFDEELNEYSFAFEREENTTTVYEIFVHAIDWAGNKQQGQVAFTIDNNLPEILITDGHKDIEDGKHYDDDKNVIVTISDLNLDVFNVFLTTNGKQVEEITDEFEVDDKGPYQDTVATHNLEFSKDGEYKINVTAIDKADNNNEKDITFTVDKNDPEITIDSSINRHVTSDYIDDSGVNNLISIELLELNVLSKSVNVTHENLEGTKTEIAEEDVGEWVQESSTDYTFFIHDGFFSVDGIYTIEVTAEDKAGRTDEETFTFTVDNTAPEVTLTNLDRYNDSAQTMTVTIFEHNYHKMNVELEVYKNGKLHDEPNWENKGERTTLDLPFPDDGEYRVVVTATDDAQNQTTKSHLFIVDTIKPELSISGIQNTDKVVHYNSNRNVTIRVQDTNIDEKRTSLKVQKLNRSTGKMVHYDVGQLDFTETSATLTHNFTTNEEGTYSIELSATDKAGNQADDEKYTFVIDNTAPVLAINGVEDGSYNASNRNVTVSVDETNYETNDVIFVVTKDGQDITSQVESNLGSNWKNARKVSRLNYNFNEDGQYSIDIRATDEAGNRAKSQSKSFTIDQTNPVIEISGVEDEQFYNEDRPVNVTIRDDNFDTNSIQVTRNGQRYNVGNFSITNNGYADSIASLNHNFSLEGDYEINVNSVDLAGNTQSEMVTFTIDKTAPVITPTMGDDGTVISDGDYINTIFTPVFLLDESEDEIVSVTLNGGSNIASNNPVASREMVYDYIVIARDRAGNETTLDLTFTVDTTRPELSITGIIEGFFNENISPVVTYSDKNLDEENTQVTLNESPYENGVSLSEEGEYILKAGIRDLASNFTERTIVFTIDKTAPIIRFEEPLSGKYFNTYVIPEILIEDLSGYDIISLTLNGEPYNLGDPIETEGKHVLYFEVRDQAGNIKQLTVEFIIDLTPPNVIFEGAEKDGKYFEPVSLSVRLDNPDDTIQSISINGDVVQGEVTEEDGFSTINLNLSEFNTYEVVVEAYDEAGNTTTAVLPFEIAEKSVLVKWYENKPLFIGSTGGLIAVLVAFGAVLAVRKKKSVVEDAEEIA